MGVQVEGVEELVGVLEDFADGVGQLVAQVGDEATSLAAAHSPTLSRVDGQPTISAGGVTVAYAGVLNPDRFTPVIGDELWPAAVRVLEAGVNDLIAEKGLA